VGGRLSYTLFDFGKREAHLKERRLQQEQTEEKLQLVKEKLEADVRKSYRGMEKAQDMVGVAREAAALRREGERLSNDQFELGLVTKGVYLEAQAARVAAEADLFRAEAGWRLSVADLKKIVGIH
jgi:outer membrane protein TolC